MDCCFFRDLAHHYEQRKKCFLKKNWTISIVTNFWPAEIQLSRIASEFCRWLMWYKIWRETQNCCTKIIPAKVRLPSCHCFLFSFIHVIITACQIHSFSKWRILRKGTAYLVPFLQLYSPLSHDMHLHLHAGVEEGRKGLLYFSNFREFSSRDRECTRALEKWHSKQFETVLSSSSFYSQLERSRFFLTLIV